MTTRRAPWWLLALFVAMTACGDDDDDSAGQGGAGQSAGGQAGASAGGQAGSGSSGSSGQAAGGASAGSSGSSGQSTGGQSGAGGQGGAAAGTSAGGASAGSTSAGGASGGGSSAGTSAGGTSAGGTGAGSGGTGSGPLARVGSCGSKTGRYFPGASWMYQDITSAPVRGNSTATTQWLTDNKGWGTGRLQIDTSFTVLEADTSAPRLERTTSDPIEYSTDCDPGVKFPLPKGGRIEGYDDYVCPDRAAGEPNDDCHLIVADLINNTLFEAYHASYEGGKFYSECSVAWDMTKDWWGAPPAPGSKLPPVSERNWGIGRDCTGPDAAGFPIAPLLFTVEEVKAGKIEHAIRFILPNARMQRAASSGDDKPVYVWPATHAGGPQAIAANAPIYGSRWRLKDSFDPAARGLDASNPVVKAVVYGLKHYGMLLSDGGNVPLSAESDAACDTKWDDLWGDKGSHVLEGIDPNDFDVLDTGGTDAGYDCVRAPR